MSLMTRTMPAINNGISKQPPILRSADQTEDEVNTWGKIASGVSRRPPTRHIAELNIPATTNAFVHHINRDISERYIVVVDTGSIKVFDMDGVEKTVNAPDGLGYLDADGPDYRAVTVADYTFIVNSERTVALEAAGNDQVAQAAYNIWPGGTNASPYADYSIIPYAGGAYQYPPNPVIAGALAGTVQRFEDLPTTGPAVGDVYKVEGSAESNFASYYVRFTGTVWDETVLPGLQNAIDPTTMPHALVRESDGTFTFAPFSWKPRRVGDGVSNPNPPFVGRKMRDVFFYQNRLGFLVDESVVFSVAGDYGDYWRRTVLDYIESDTVSVAATTTDVALLDFAVPFNDGIMLFSAQRQFALSNGESGLSAVSVEMNPVTSFVMADNVRPAAMGSRVYFASDAAGYTSMQEYTRLDGSDATDGAEITAHIPGLIPQGVSSLVNATDINTVFTLVSRSTSKDMLFPYQFFWDGDRKIISAWRKWKLDGAEILSGTYVDSSLWLVLKRDSKMYLERIDMSPGATSDAQANHIHLDRQVLLTGTYNAGTNLTTFNLPYVADQDTFTMVRSETADVPESIIPTTHITFTDPTTVTVEGDESGAPVTVGHKYLSTFKFSQQFALDFQGRPLVSGRLQIHTMTVNYTDTAYFRVNVSPYGDDAVINGGLTTYSQDFTGRLIGTSGFILGKQVYRTGSFQFSVAGDAKAVTIELENDSPYGSTFVSAEWEALYYNRAL